MASGVELATAYVSLVVEGSKVTPGVKQALGGVEGEAGRTGTRSGKALGSGMSKSFASHAKNIAAGLGVAFGISKGISFLKDSNAEAREAQKVGAQTNAVLKSTGGVANVTAKQISNLSTAISNKVGIDHKVIQSGENMLLTFRNIRNETGKGNNVFNQATRSLVDMSVALGKDPKTAAIQLGKALNDPVKGLTALGRAGVQFTDKQKATIKSMVKTGDILGAQKVILKELNSEFGGSAAAQATAGDKARVAWKDLQEQIGTALLPVVDKFSNLMSSKIVPGISKFVTGMQDGSGAGGQFAGKLRELWGAGSRLVSVFTSLPGGVKKFAIQGLLAYAAMSKLQSVTGGLRLTGFISQLANSETRLDAVGRASYRLGQAARTAAGAGGLLLLADGMHNTSKSVGALETTLGGALTGFSVGGPWGAAIGAGVGLFAGLTRETDKAVSAAKTYASTLDQVSAKITQSTKQTALKNLGSREGSGWLEFASQVGLPTPAIISAMTGPIGDYEALRKRVFAFKGVDKAAADKFLGYIDDQRAALGTGRVALLKQIAATRQYTGAIKTLPKRVQTDIKTNGLEPTRKAIVGLTAKYHLTPKSIRTLIRENGGKPTKAAIDGIIARAKVLNAQRATAHVAVKGATEAIRLISGVRGMLANLDGKRADTYVTHHVTTLGGLLGAPSPRKKAGGGRVLAGQPYTVGELRQETFVPDTNGRINPNPSAGGSGGGSGVWHLYDVNNELMATMEGVADTRVLAATAI